MEKGRWGHNSAFHQEQVRVPLVIRLPGKEGGETSRMTSHLDIAPTLLPLLGVTNNSSDYAQGFDLLGPERRDFTIISDWSRVCYVDEKYKEVIPLTASSIMRGDTSARDDTPLADPTLFDQTHLDFLQQMMKGLGKFKRGATS